MNDSIPIPFLADENNPDITYHLGFALSPQTKAEIADFEPSIIHITVPDCTALHLIQYARYKEIPIMGTYHSNIPEYMEHYPGLSWLKVILGAFFRHSYNFMQALYVPTPFIQKFLVDNYKMDSVTNLGVWGRGVDIDNFHPDHRSLKYRHQLNIADDTPIIVWVGRLVPEKRPDIFANVVRRLSAQGLNFHALVIGAGPCEDEFKTLPNTTFCGWMTPAQLSVAYASSDVFLFPSAVETFGNVTLEAASSGLPVVVEAGCSGHLVANNGFACPAGDEDAFYQATLELVRNEKLRNSCSRVSRELALTMEKRAVVQAMLENYSRVTDQFYTEYGGHHANRDRVYRKPDSFRGGTMPRPMLLIVVEWLSVVMFQVIFNMTNVFMSMQEGFMSMGLPSLRFDATLPEDLPSLPISQSEESAIQVVYSQDSPLVQADSVTEDSSVEEQVSSLYSDTETTDEDSLSDVSLNTAVKSSPLCVSAAQRHCWEDPVSHKLAGAFVWAVELQCRLESRVRNAFSCCAPAQFTAKRKNSSFALDDDDEEGDNQLLRSRSSPFGEGHRLRRQGAINVV